jgi:uncharacterized protein (TIGR02444 family)
MTDRAQADSSESFNAASPLWRFSLAFYSRPEVPALLLRLQDECDADVNVVLFGLWRAGQYRSLSSDDFLAIDSVIQKWRAEIVVPMRTVRRTIKGSQDGSAAVDALYTAAKRLELEAERIEQSRLFAAAHLASGVGAETIEQAVTLSLNAYGRTRERMFPADVIMGLTTALEDMIRWKARGNDGI